MGDVNSPRWQILPRVPDSFAQQAGLPLLLAQLLYNRGLRTPSACHSFLQPDVWQHTDPFLVKDMDVAVRRIGHALEHGETTAVYGDFDTDGISGATLLTEVLALLGGNVITHIPHRLDDGYGLSFKPLKDLHNQGVSLVITVDCGISSVDEIAYAQRLGLDVIVTDHHSLPTKLPSTTATLNPKRPDSAYPFRDFSGAGVAYKLAQALVETHAGANHQAILNDTLDLVALGTVADLAPLVGENRYLVVEGLRVLNQTQRLGLQALIAQAGLRLGHIDAEDIAFVLGPRLNAAGRLDHAIIGLRLLASGSEREAQELAAKLEQTNAERQRLTAQALSRAQEEIATFPATSPLFLLQGDHYPGGVIGLVAGKLCEEHHRPVVVLERGPRISRGSARSIPELNIAQTLAQCQDLLIRFGGHARAAGFMVANSRVDALRERLLHIAQRELRDLDLRPALTIDAEVSLQRLGWHVLEMVEQLQPFGMGNPQPLFLSRGVEVKEKRLVGARKDHLRLLLSSEGQDWPAIGFGLGSRLAEVAGRIDVVCALKADEWNGEKRLQLLIQDFNPSGSGR